MEPESPLPHSKDMTTGTYSRPDIVSTHLQTNKQTNQPTNKHTHKQTNTHTHTNTNHFVLRTILILSPTSPKWSFLFRLFNQSRTIAINFCICMS
jgi:hypothetical protein